MSDHPHTDRELLLLVNEKLDTIIDRSDDHEERIRCLETNQNKILGVAVSFSAIMAIIGAKISGLLFGS